jgi:hypothetical protein
MAVKIVVVSILEKEKLERGLSKLKVFKAGKQTPRCTRKAAMTKGVQSVCEDSNAPDIS